VARAPEVSVVIPTRDRWSFLPSHALASALGQVDVELEVVVVDDGSADGTAAGLALVTDPRLRVVRHETARGVAGARNAGLAAARGEWVAFLDDDDLWSPLKLRRQLDTARRRGADFVYAAGVLVDGEKRVTASDIFPAESELVARLRTSNVVPGGCSGVLARTDLVRDVGGFDEKLSYTEDWDLWIRLAAKGRAGACPDVLVAHVEHAGNALFRYRPDVVTEFEYVLRKHARSGEPESLGSARVQVLEWLAQEYLRAGHARDAARAHLQIARERRSLTPVARALVSLSGGPSRGAIRRVRRLVSSAGRTAADPLPPADPDWLGLYR
jgi:glycosyltransferase involved in cell wall biosynthesis